uniref:CRM domain-containing protein n=1 Tax=Rhizophora mucronata TaxID=61149 RepID=A0A2P2K913_RHIMU
MYLSDIYFGMQYLTGGVLLLRNKFFIILYRGKDFLPCQVAKFIVDREHELRQCQLNEEHARLRATETFFMAEEPLEKSSKVGTLHEFRDVQLKFGVVTKQNRQSELQLDAEREKLERELRTQEKRLFILQRKIEKAARELSKLNAAWAPTEKDADQEMLTQEERECFRKIGLKMHSSLVLGRRGVFDGVVEGLHQHWKHREVVKVITMQRNIAQIMYTANFLEAESGGALVSVDKLKEGHAIIIYRGKNYRRPSKLLAANLLTKREALHRSLLMQRIGSLKFFAYKRQSTISEIILNLAELQKSQENNQGRLQVR